MDSPALNPHSPAPQLLDSQLSDSQWPRWEVFKQDAAGKPHQAVGSVHATDPEHALFTARSVFARRPAAVSLWVVPETQIHSLTQEELDAGHRFADPAGPDSPGPDSAEPEQPYRVFGKRSHKRSMTFMDELGTVMARNPNAALSTARAEYGDLLAWWIIAQDEFLGSPDDAGTLESWFAPAKDKTYKQQSSYGVIGQHASARNPRRKGDARE
jgi:ring-1,2-phenylacetyl-CoA epoxidase subunit PaaB